MPDYDTWADFRVLAGEVADALGQLRSEQWEVAAWHEDHAHPSCTLAPVAGHGPEHARIGMQHGYDDTDRVTVKGIWPNDSTYKAPSRNVDPRRGARTVAQAISTYILRVETGYLDELPRRAEDKRTADERRDRRDAIVARLAGLVEAEVPPNGKLSLSPYLDKRGEVSVSLGNVMDPDAPTAVSLEMHGLDVDTALAMIEVFAASPAARGRCCRQFGRGHDQRLSLLGCERAAERDAPPTMDEGDALYSLYRQYGGDQDWQTWLDGAQVHTAWQ